MEFALFPIVPMTGRDSRSRKADAPKRTKESAALKCAAPIGPLPSLSPIRQPG